MDFSQPRVIVEYGPGEGCHTREIVRQMHPDSQVILFELDSELEDLSVKLRTYGGCRVKITTTDGAEYEEVVIDSKGTVDNPMSRDEIERKFRLVAGRVIPAPQVDAIIDLCASLDQLDDLQQFGAAIRDGN